MNVGIVRFPGSNCDEDCFKVITQVLGEKADYLWHEDRFIGNVDLVILPGGFAHGDYLRAGAMAKLSPIMKPIVAFASKGGMVLGICNGFQVLTEAGLLPGALLRNEKQKFICDWVYLKVENNKTLFTSLYYEMNEQPPLASGLRVNEKQVFSKKTRYGENEIIRMPIAHGEGRYYVDDSTLNELEKNKQVVFRYCTDQGELKEGANPNGSKAHIAGVCNKEGNVLGLMPHPERCSEPILGGHDGLRLFKSVIQNFVVR